MTKYIYALIVLLAISCTRDFNIEVPVAPDGNEVEAILTLQVPRSQGTKALTASDENKIETVDVLVFKRSGTDTTYFYQSFTSLIVDNAPSPGDTVKNYRISVKADGSDQQFVVFANTMSLIRGLTLTETMTRRQVLDLITMTITDKWNSTTGSYDPIPMWGQTPFRPITTAASARATITMARAVARLDVLVNTATQSVFELHEVIVYNAPMNGRLAPTDANWDGNDKVTGVSIPPGGWNKSSIPFSYLLPAPNDSLLSNTVYTFECPPSTSNTDPSATCLVVRGSWNGNTDSWYRLDFVDPGGQFLALLRNHQYKVVISSVTGNGHGSAAIAMSSGSTNITAITINLTSGDMRYVIWDGMNWLGFSDKEISFYNPAVNYKLRVATNVPAGWGASVRPADAGWLSITGPAMGQGTTAIPDTLQISLTKNTTGADRTGWIYISADRLRDSIMVTQSNTSILWLEVGDAELAFSASSVSSTVTRVEWEPAAIPCEVSLIPLSGSGYTPITFIGNPIGSTISDADGDPTNGGAINLVLTPDAATTLSGFDERRGILRINAIDGDGVRTPYKDILLRQYNLGIVVSGKYLSGDTIRCQPITTNQLTIRSNGEWEVVLPSNPNIIDTYNYSEEANTTTGEIFTFKTKDLTGTNPGAISDVITFRHKLNPTVFKTCRIILEPILPNCYIVNPIAGSNFVDINIKKVFHIWNNDPDLAGLIPGGLDTLNATIELIYQDDPGLITSIFPATPAVVPASGVFRVNVSAPASSPPQGNAVVGVRMNGQIRWTWHIWVLTPGNDPRNGSLTSSGSNSWYQQPVNGAILMNRNLGSVQYYAPLTADPTNTYSFGLYYQHGRMTPFPGPPSINTSGVRIPKTIYDIGGNVITTAGYIKRAPVGATTSLPNRSFLSSALRDPRSIFYDNNTNDWYYNNTGGVRRDNMWSNDREWKGVYDPCPHGWKVPTGDDVLFIGLAPFAFRSDGFGSPNDTPLGYFPASGILDPGSSSAGANDVGTYTDVGGVGGVYHSWSARVNGVSGEGGQHIASSTTMLNSSAPKKYAMPVRCIKVQ